MTFHPITEPVDYILLAGQRSPGVAEVVAADSPRRWDERRGYGLSGAHLVYRGAGLSHPVVTLKLFEEQHFEDWRTWGLLVMREPWPDAASIEQQGRRVDAARRERDELATQLVSNPRLASTNPEVVERLETVGARAQERVGFAPRRPRALDIWHPILEDLGITSVVIENVLQPKQTADGEWTIEIRMIEHRAPVYALARPEGSQAQPQDRFEALIQQEDSANQALRDRLAS